MSAAPRPPGTTLVVTAASLGTMFEWYDFYLYGILATQFGPLFFPKGEPTFALLSSLALFGVGFSVRPFGALVFGRLGDLVGRKHTFLVTILVMGFATALVGVVPTYERIGVLAPAILVLLRVLQGLALGGEYGGAATYVAEFAPADRRGLYTSWIQTTATLGLALALGVIVLVQQCMDAARFAAWGWRIPFLVSLVLLAISVWIRLRLQESPAFAAMKAAGRTSRAPLRESFLTWRHARVVLAVLFGATAGQSVVCLTSQFYALTFLTSTLKVATHTAYLLVGIAFVLGTPMLLLTGWLSDRIGRKKLVVGGFLLAALSFPTLFRGLTTAANPALAAIAQQAPVVLHTGEDTDSLTLTLGAIGEAARKIALPPAPSASPTQRARLFLNQRGVPFALAKAAPGAELTLDIGGRPAVQGFDEAAFANALDAAGYDRITVALPDGRRIADPDGLRSAAVVGWLLALFALAALVYGPLAAWLCELFPTRIRYSALSLPYHVGNGWFGGFLPLIASSIVVATGDIYAGLWFPIAIASVSCVVAAITLGERLGAPLDHDEA